jgi:flagellar biogenesis protein FliO
MFAIFSTKLARSQSALGDSTSLAGAFARWLSLPVQRGAEPSLRLLESVPLTAQASLALVRFGTENLVLGVTAQKITVLSRGEAVACTKSEEREVETRSRDADAAQFNSPSESKNPANPIP